MSRLVLFLGTVAAWLCLQAAAISAAPKLKTLPIREVPSIISYIEQTYADYNLDHPDQFQIRVGDLDIPANGVNEVVISVNPVTPDTCGPRGCLQEVIRFGLMDSVVSVFTDVGPQFKFDDAFAKKIAGLLAKSSEGHPFPPPIPRAVDLRKVPGLQDYLSQKYGDLWRSKEEVFRVRTFDLDEQENKTTYVEEVLLSIDRFDPAFCSNAGCHHEVLVRMPDGKLKVIVSYTGFGLEVADTTTNGVRDLITQTSKGNRRLNLAGQTSGTRKDTPSQPEAKDISAQRPEVKEQFRSACSNFKDWVGGHYTNGEGKLVGVASYGHCGHLIFNRWMDFKCVAGSGKIELSLPDTLENVERDTPLSVPWVIDGKQFDIAGVARKARPLVDPTPELSFDRNNGLLEAMKSGRRGSYQLSKYPSRFWLEGSAPAISHMLKICDGPAGSESQAQANPDPQPVDAKVTRLPNGIIEYRPACFNRHYWFGQSGQGSGSASYRGCGDGEYWFEFSCAAGSSTLHLSIESVLRRARNGMAVTISAFVDRKRFDLRGRARDSEMLGGAQPILTFERPNGLLQALMTGSSAVFVINGIDEPFHLHGAKGSVETMLKGCGTLPANSDIQTATTKPSAAAKKPVIVVTKAHVTGKGFGYDRNKSLELPVCKGTPHVEVINQSGKRQEIWMGPPDSGFIDRKIWLRNGQKGRIDLYGLTTGEQLPEYTVLNAGKDFSYLVKLVDC